MSFDIHQDVMGNDYIEVKVSTAKIRELCEPYIEQIVDTKLLASKLYEFLTTANSYFYELYLCVIDILVQIGELPKEMEFWSNILLFLKYKMVTKRPNRISQIETDWWLRTNDGMAGVMQKIAKYRLPFQMLISKPLKDILGNFAQLNRSIKITRYFDVLQFQMPR